MRGRQHSSLRVVWAPSLLRRVLRNRFFQASVVVTVGCISALTLSARAAALEDARASWGALQQVVIVVEPVAAGDLIVQSVELRAVPVALAPGGAVNDLHPQSRAKVALFTGEIVLTDRVTTEDGRGLAPGTMALTLSVVAQVPLVQEGDLVDLWMVDSANFSSRRVAANVVVLAFSDQDITVAVPDDQIADATVASLRPVTITLVG